MQNEIEITNPDGDRIAALIRGEFVVWIPRGPGGFLHEEAKVIIDPNQLQEAIDFASGKVLESISHHPEGIERDGVTVFAERTYQYKGCVYRIRDVKGPGYTEDGSRILVGGDGWDRNRTLPRFVPEYAVKSEDGKTIWKPFREGANFDDMEPFEKAA